MVTCVMGMFRFLACGHRLIDCHRLIGMIGGSVIGNRLLYLVSDCQGAAVRP